MDEETGHYSAGMVDNKLLVCQSVHFASSKGYLFGDNPLNYSTPVFMIQIVLITFITRIIFFMLRPLHQTTIITQIIAGILIGPSFLVQDKEYSTILFPPASRQVLSTFANFGIMIHFFKIGVQINTNLLRSIRKKDVFIGLSNYMGSFAFGFSAHTFFHSCITPFNETTNGDITIMVLVISMTSFANINSFLKELNILNTDIGRLASSTSVVTDVFAWLMTFVGLKIGKALRFSTFIAIFDSASLLSYYAILLFFLRPLVIKIANRTPEGRPMKETHFLMILCVVMVVGLVGQCVGQRAFMGAFALGVSLPDGPPLATTLVQRMETITSVLMVPMFCTLSGLATELRSVLRPQSVIIEIIIILTYIGKFTGTMLCARFYAVPLRESFALGLILCSKGIVELSFLNILNGKEEHGTYIFSLSVINLVVITGIVTFTVSHIYDPSQRYRTFIQKTIKHDPHLSILFCIHNPDNVHPIIDLLELSNPTSADTISICVLRLIELKGRAASVLENANKSSDAKQGFCSPILNAFNQCEQRHGACVSVQHFTSIAPYSSMHNDICTIAWDNQTCIVIMPFHKQWSVEVAGAVSVPAIRRMNRNVLKNAPCSVGILIDRSQFRGTKSMVIDQKSCQIAMIFAGGADDLEALAYAQRMATHPNVTLKVIWLRSYNKRKGRGDEKFFNKVMEDVKADAEISSNMTFMEEFVIDGVRTTDIFRKLESSADLVMVGRQHDADSPITLGLTEWNEFPELGLIGDMLASADFMFSVLVVQQEFINC